MVLKPESSFPFLNIAQHFGIPYAEVLAIRQALLELLDGVKYFAVSERVVLAVIDATKTEATRRAKVVSNG